MPSLGGGHGTIFAGHSGAANITAPFKDGIETGQIFIATESKPSYNSKKEERKWEYEKAAVKFFKR